MQEISLGNKSGVWPGDFRLKILPEMLSTWLNILKILQLSLPFENNSGFVETSSHNPRHRVAEN